jgi:hypothetical protein
MALVRHVMTMRMLSWKMRVLLSVTGMLISRWKRMMMLFPSLGLEVFPFLALVWQRLL